MGDDTAPPVHPDDVLEGAIDLHHHGYPEISLEHRTRDEDAEEIRLARAAGMAGLVLKSHMWPTVGRTYLLSRMVPGIAIIPSITLNPVVGGFSPMAVESAARQGAAVLFMPTWGAAHDVVRGGMSRHMRHILTRVEIPGDGLHVTDAGGRLLPEVRDCLTVAAEFGMAVATGHIAPRESLALAAAANDMGLGPVLFQHPDSNSTAATRDEIREMAALGAIIEICALGFLPPYQRITIETALEIIQEVTPHQIALTTDYFFSWSPPGPEQLRMLSGILHAKGVPADDLHTMLRDVPRRFLRRHD